MTRPFLWATAVAMAMLMPPQSMGGANVRDALDIDNDPYAIQVAAQSSRTDEFAHTSLWKSPGPMVVPAPQLPIAPAQAGVIAFMDYCTHRVYAIRGDGTGRVELPLPPLPQPATAFGYSLQLLDVTTSDPTTSGRPTTVVYRLAIIRRDGSEPARVALYAVQMNDAGTGVLAPGPPVRLTLPDIVAVNGAAGVNPNDAVRGAFSTTGAEERLALVAQTATATVLMTVKVDRDETGSVTSLSDVVVIADLYSLVPDLGLDNLGPGSIDYAPDGSGVVAAINHDLWLVRLTSEHTLDAAEQLTSTANVVEWNPSYSPDGLRVAYTGGSLLKDGTVGTPDLYTIAVFGGAVTRITSTLRKGKFRSPDDAMWTAGGTSIGFAAYTSSTVRRAACSALVNREIFLISADGSGTASLITDTNGTSVEGLPKWGW